MTTYTGRHTLPSQKPKRWRSHLGHILEGLTFGTGAIFVAEIELDLEAGMWSRGKEEISLLVAVIMLSWGRSWAKE